MALISQRRSRMRVPAVVFVVSSAMVSANGPALAQNVLPLADGETVRVTAPSIPMRLYGHALFDRLDRDVLTIATPGDDARVTMPLASASRVDVSLGRAREKGAAIGAAAGLLAGGIVGGAVQGKDDPRGYVVGAVVFGAAGSVVGGVLGFAYAPERWRTLYSNTPTEASYRVALRSDAQIKRLDNGGIAVRGERNRRAGMARGAIALGGIGVIFGGIDAARGTLSGKEYASTVIGNAAIGAAIGYLIAPRGWQQLPPLPASPSQ